MSLLMEKLRTGKRQSETMKAEEIVTHLRQLEQMIRDNEALFNMTLEGDLLEACIYDGQALRSRYRYYHNMARSMGIKVGNLR